MGGLKYAQDILEPVKQKFPDVSYADLWIFAAGVAIEEMGGEKVEFIPGRVDKKKGWFGSPCPSWTGETHKGQPWTGPLQYEDPTGELMMLPSDIVLTEDVEFRKWVEYYAKEQDAFQKDFAKVVGKLFNLRA